MGAHFVHSYPGDAEVVFRGLHPTPLKLMEEDQRTFDEVAFAVANVALRLSQKHAEARTTQAEAPPPPRAYRPDARSKNLCLDCGARLPCQHEAGISPFSEWCCGSVVGRLHRYGCWRAWERRLPPYNEGGLEHQRRIRYECLNLIPGPLNGGDHLYAILTDSVKD